MKIVISILLLICTYTAHSQKCETIKQFNSFRGIRLGERMGDSIKKYFEVIPVGKDSLVYLDESAVKRNPSLKKFLTIRETFEVLDVRSLSDGRVYQLALSRKGDSHDTLSLQSKESPAFLVNVYNALAAIMGETTEREQQTKDIGNAYVYRWECENIKIDLMVSNVLGIIYYLTFTDKNLMDIKRLEEYK